MANQPIKPELRVSAMISEEPPRREMVLYLVTGVGEARRLQRIRVE